MRSSRGCHVLRQAALGLFFVALVATGLQAQKIKVEYDKSLDFATFKTFAWGSTMPSLARCWPSRLQAQSKKSLPSGACTRPTAIQTFMSRCTVHRIRTWQ